MSHVESDLHEHANGCRKKSTSTLLATLTWAAHARYCIRRAGDNTTYRYIRVYWRCENRECSGKITTKGSNHALCLSALWLFLYCGILHCGFLHCGFSAQCHQIDWACASARLVDEFVFMAHLLFLFSNNRKCSLTCAGETGRLFTRALLFVAALRPGQRCAPRIVAQARGRRWCWFLLEDRVKSSSPPLVRWCST